MRQCKCFNFTNQSGSRYSTDFNTLLTTGFFNADGTPTNCPTSYANLIVAKGIDTGLQIAGGIVVMNYTLEDGVLLVLLLHHEEQ